MRIKVPVREKGKKAPTQDMAGFLQRVFMMMGGAVLITAISSVLMLMFGMHLLITAGGPTPLFYILIFGGLGISMFTQFRVFNMDPVKGGMLLVLYAVMMGMVMSPLIAVAIINDPATIFQAFFIASAMFGAMALFGYKTARDLGFLGIFLFMGMIGLILVGIMSIFWPLGSGFMTIVALIGVLVFALFTAYGMQGLKKIYPQMANKYGQNQLAVLGALQLYISFIAMFQYILMLLNRR